jgi:hypothetical protein
MRTARPIATCNATRDTDTGQQPPTDSTFLFRWQLQFSTATAIWCRSPATSWASLTKLAGSTPPVHGLGTA